MGRIACLCRTCVWWRLKVRRKERKRSAEQDEHGIWISAGRYVGFESRSVSLSATSDI
jgi:hypothetical protein